MVLNINNFDAVIFDMDGTIVDNMDIHLKAWQKFCKKHEIRLSKKEFKT